MPDNLSLVTIILLRYNKTKLVALRLTFTSTLLGKHGKDWTMFHGPKPERECHDCLRFCN